MWGEGAPLFDIKQCLLIFFFLSLFLFYFHQFRCVDLGPKIGQLLDADFSKHCFQGVHAEYVPYAIISCVVYLIGLPLCTFILLFKNRKKLRSPAIESKYGVLYRQYEHEWYWWECLLMLEKCFLTGAMVAIAPGSPIQLLIALIVCVSYVLLVVYAGPYKGAMEDRLAFFSKYCCCYYIVHPRQVHLFRLLTKDEQG